MMGGSGNAGGRLGLCKAVPSRPICSRSSSCSGLGWPEFSGLMDWVQGGVLSWSEAGDCGQVCGCKMRGSSDVVAAGVKRGASPVSSSSCRARVTSCHSLMAQSRRRWGGFSSRFRYWAATPASRCPSTVALCRR